MPMLAITDPGTANQPGQNVRIVQDTAYNFRADPSFTIVANNQVIWDPDHNGVSDVSYAVQCGNQAPLYRADTAKIAWEQYPEGSATAVGVAGALTYLVVVDGEGIYGGCKW
jgi:hypothetical protein